MIKNIIFDVDGVLVDVNQCYLKFLQNTYKQFEHISMDDLAVLFPINPDDGAIKLPDEFFNDFRTSSYYSYRPLFDGVRDALVRLRARGLKLFTLSAASHPARKLQWIAKEFGDLFDAYEFSPSGKLKTDALQDLLQKYSLDKTETIFIDDRIQHVRAGICVGCHVARCESNNTLPLPKDLDCVHVVHNITEFEDFINSFNTTEKV